MSANEYLLLHFLASYIKPTDKEFKEYKFSKSQLLDMLKLGKENYSALRLLTKKIIGRVYEIDTPSKLIQVAALSRAEYSKIDDTVTLSFDPALKPFLLELRANFTSADISNFSNLASFYSMKLYELLKQYEKIGVRRFTLEELRYILTVGIKYPLYADFKRRVIDFARDELRDKTDIRFDYSEETIRRRVIALTFTIKHNPSPEEREAIRRAKKALSDPDSDRLEIRRQIKDSLKNAAEKPGGNSPDLF